LDAVEDGQKLEKAPPLLSAAAIAMVLPSHPSLFPLRSSVLGLATIDSEGGSGGANRLWWC